MTRTLDPPSADAVARERGRMSAAYERMAITRRPERYAPWQPAEMLMREERLRVAVRLLRRAHAFPADGDRCLEVGCGNRGWLADLLTWGLPADTLHGLDFDAGKIAAARRCLPGIDLRVGDATALPWPAGAFRLVIASTVLSSILDPTVRAAVAQEMVRVTAPGGACLCYDLRVRSPRNPDLHPITRRHLRDLFAGLDGAIQSIALAPPLARLLAAHAHPIAVALQALPPLRSHLLAVLVKP